jgi:hypothetical protein
MADNGTGCRSPNGVKGPLLFKQQQQSSLDQDHLGREEVIRDARER